MRINWTMAAFLSAVLIIGCGDRKTDKSSDFEAANVAPDGGIAASDESVEIPESSPPVDTPAVRDARPSSSPRTESRTATQRPPRSADRSSVAPAPRQTPENRGTNVVAETTARALRTEPPAARQPVWRELTITSGTAVPLELLTALSSETAQVESPVRARVRQDIVVDGYTVVPAGSIVTGTVTEVERPGRIRGRAQLVFGFNEVQLAGGREDLRTNPISFEGEASKGEDATKVGAGAGIGAIIGGIAGGKEGAVKGGAIGAGAGTGAVLATRGKDVVVASGTDITATLAAPTTIRVQAR